MLRYGLNKNINYELLEMILRYVVKKCLMIKLLSENTTLNVSKWKKEKNYKISNINAMKAININCVRVLTP